MASRWKQGIVIIFTLSLLMTACMIGYTWNNSYTVVRDVSQQFADLPPIEELADPQHNGYRRIAHFAAKAQDTESDNLFWRRFGDKGHKALDPKQRLSNEESFGDVQFFGAERKNGESDTKMFKYPLKGEKNASDSKYKAEKDTFEDLIQNRNAAGDTVPTEKDIGTVNSSQTVHKNRSAINLAPIVSSDGAKITPAYPLHHIDDKGLNYPTKAKFADIGHRVTANPSREKYNNANSDKLQAQYPTKPRVDGKFMKDANGLPYPTKPPSQNNKKAMVNSPPLKPAIEESIVMPQDSSNNVDNTNSTSVFKMPITPMPRIDGENVIAMTLYGSSLRYTMGALRNAELAKENFPGWKLRIYTEAPSESPRHGIVPQTVISKLRGLDVDIHYMQPGEDFVPPMMWRFLVADDMWVDRFIIRDSDARLSERDAAAVYAWVKSDQPFNCIRDHPSHAAYAISGGMWGGKPRELKDILRRSWKTMMRGVRPDYLQDMNFLNYYIWPKVQQHAYCSDSVSCEQFPGAHPFPVPRFGYEHVGQVVNEHDLGRPIDIQILRAAGENQNCVPNVDIKKLLRGIQ